MRYRWHLKHNGIIKEVKRWVVLKSDDGYEIHRITLDDGSFHNSCDEDFSLTEPAVEELMEYRKELNKKRDLNKQKEFEKRLTDIEERFKDHLMGLI